MKQIPVISMCVLCAGLGACGGGKGGKPLSRSELDLRANAICRRAVGAAKALPVPPNILTSASAASAYFDEAAPIVDRETSDLSALKPDASVSADWNAFISVRKSTAKTIDLIRQKADAHDPSGIGLLQGIAGPARQMSSAAQKLGAADCAR
jgi:hypothetical protein